MSLSLELNKLWLLIALLDCSSCKFIGHANSITTHHKIDMELYTADDTFYRALSLYILVVIGSMSIPKPQDSGLL